MKTSFKTTGLLVTLVGTLAFSGCQSVNSGLNSTPPPQPLPSAPTDPVQMSSLDPIDPNQQTNAEVPDPSAEANKAAEEAKDAVPGAPTTPENTTEVASLETTPAPAAQPITREGMAGSWNVPSDNSECRIILAFTKWSGGYRAATRRCNSPEIGSITAWDVKDRQVVLVDNAGNTVARLYASGEAKYDGTTNGGQGISFRR